METTMRWLAVAFALSLAVAPAAAQPRPASPPVTPLQDVPRLWGAPVADFPGSFNSVARQVGLDIRAVAGPCRSNVQTACEVRLGSLAATLRAQNQVRLTEEIMLGIGGGSAAGAMDGLSVVTVLLRWAAPRADAGELRAAFNALFPGGSVDGVREVTLHGTRFQRLTMPGVGMMITAGPAN